MKIRSIVAGVTAAALLSTTAFAADYSTYSGSTFDWDGFYAGLGIKGSSLSNGVVTETTGYLDAIAGVNVTMDEFLFGLEGWVGGYSISTGTTGWQGGVEARAGYLVAPEALLYVSGGGQFYDGGANYGTIGLGAEFAVTDSMTFDVEYKYWGWSNNGYKGHSIGVSALYHF